MHEMAKVSSNISLARAMNSKTEAMRGLHSSGSRDAAWFGQMKKLYSEFVPLANADAQSYGMKDASETL